MINITELRPGNTFEYEGNIFSCLDIALNKTAMAKMKVKVKAKNLRTGGVLELSFIGGDKVELAHLDKKKMQYLYSDGTSLVFMDNETFDMMPIAASQIGDALKFVKENMDCKILSYKGNVFGIEPPNFVELLVTETEPGVKGDTATGATKPATLETGATIMVPLFINENDMIRVDTRTGEYMERA